MIDYLKLTRPLNLFIIILTQAMIKYGLLVPLEVSAALNKFQFGLLIAATLFTAAAGNVINDLYDVAVDNINKPNKVIVGRSVSEKGAFYWYVVLNILGVGLGFYLANSIGHPGLAAVFIIVSALLYAYATQLKNIILGGNLLVSLLVAMSLIVVVLFDIFPAIQASPATGQLLATKLIMGYAGFAFYINLIRELVKDIQDIDGDKNGGRNTLAISLGRQRTANVVFILGAIALLTVLLVCYVRLYLFQKLLAYTIFMIAAPLLYFCVKAWKAKSKRDFAHLSLVLKIVMLTGIGSMLFFAEIAPEL